MYATTVYPAKAWLSTTLKAWSWPDGAPDILWGPPTQTGEQTADLIHLTGTTVPEDVYVTLGGTRTDETYALMVVIDVRRWGNDEQATEQHAWSHFNQLLALVNADKTFGGAVNRVTGFRFTQVNPAPDAQSPDQWRTQIAVDIAVVGLVTTT